MERYVRLVEEELLPRLVIESVDPHDPVVARDAPGRPGIQAEVEVYRRLGVLMTADGRGLVADISDFLEPESDGKWEDLKRAYYKFYRPWFYRHPVPIPLWVLNVIRKSYRLYQRIFGSSS
ncbi:MAG TPA: hypothetical protein VK464_29210 [Symbiobacteriaceae bacterium]|jgi:hypothetical protein|nr:hypothetical protein [Symbiobacteriaceae bacterium]